MMVDGWMNVERERDKREYFIASDKDPEKEREREGQLFIFRDSNR